MNTTTQTFARTARKSGTEYAASIERSRRRDISGQIIVFLGCAAVMAVGYFFAWSQI